MFNSIVDIQDFVALQSYAFSCLINSQKIVLKTKYFFFVFKTCPLNVLVFWPKDKLSSLQKNSLSWKALEYSVFMCSIQLSTLKISWPYGHMSSSCLINSQKIVLKTKYFFFVFKTCPLNVLVFWPKDKLSSLQKNSLSWKALEYSVFMCSIQLSTLKISWPYGHMSSSCLINSQKIVLKTKYFFSVFKTCPLNVLIFWPKDKLSSLQKNSLSWKALEYSVFMCSIQLSTLKISWPYSHMSSSCLIKSQKIVLKTKYFFFVFKTCPLNVLVFWP